MKTDPLILYWSEVGVTSCYDISLAIEELGQMIGLINRLAKVILTMTIS